ncbi:MAG: hypothetical protein PHW10_00235 [Candidatus Peribacteraceae bacterium]|nr:hypothetical protein [Candidatus Peribacteraceae bacterium]
MSIRIGFLLLLLLSGTVIILRYSTNLSLRACDPGDESTWAECDVPWCGQDGECHDGCTEDDDCTYVGEWCAQNGGCYSSCTTDDECPLETICSDSACIEDPCGDGSCGSGEECAADCSSETYCDDGVDNDQDVYTDCDDSDCEGEPACDPCGDGSCDPLEQCAADCSSETHCDDGVDNDEDTGIDCDDLDCEANLVCMCGNGSCDDGEVCAADCPDEAYCEDGVDNDEDGDTDCDDSGCAADSACIPDCGNGSLDDVEECDDGNTSDYDGCSADCIVEEGYECTVVGEACNLICSNGLIDDGEACDDGDADAGDGCSAACAIEDGYECTGEPSVCTEEEEEISSSSSSSSSASSVLRPQSMGGGRGGAGGTNAQTIGGAGESAVRGRQEQMQSASSAQRITVPVSEPNPWLLPPVRETVSVRELREKMGTGIHAAAPSDVQVSRGEAVAAVLDRYGFDMPAADDRALAGMARSLGILRGYDGKVLALDRPVSPSELLTMMLRSRVAVRRGERRQGR